MADQPHRPVRGLRAVAYDALWWCAEVLQSAASGCLYLAAGLLRRDELRASTNVQWSTYNVSAQEVDRGLDDWEERFYGRHLKHADRILMLGCGAGRDLIALCAEGYDVTGVDQHAELIEQARRHFARRGLSAHLITAPLETVPLDGQYDVALLTTCYSSIQQSSARVAALARIRAHLAAGGRVLLAYPTYTGQRSLSRRLMNVASMFSGAGWRAERGDVFSRAYSGRRALAYQHYFTPEDVARECADAGLRLVEDYAEEEIVRCAVARAD